MTQDNNLIYFQFHFLYLKKQTQSVPTGLQGRIQLGLSWLLRRSRVQLGLSWPERASMDKNSGKQDAWALAATWWGTDDTGSKKLTIRAACTGSLARTSSPSRCWATPTQRLHCVCMHDFGQVGDTHGTERNFHQFDDDSSNQTPCLPLAPAPMLTPILGRVSICCLCELDAVDVFASIH